MKRCATCKDSKPLFNFRKDNSRKDKLSVSCTLCLKNRSNLAYKQKYAKSILEKNNKIREAVAVIKRNLGCLVCGESEPVCLDFHHPDPSIKELQVSDATSFSFAKVLVEIDKCLCLCSNCHRKVHAGIIFLD